MDNTIGNVDNVKDRIKYAGFGTYFNAYLDQRLAAGEQVVMLSKRRKMDHNKDAEINYALEVKVNQPENNAYYNGFAATVIESSGQRRGQWFPASEKITEKEAENLLRDTRNPRAVYKKYSKDGQKYGTWIQLDFTKVMDNGNFDVKRFHDKYGFNLEAKLLEYNFKDFDKEEYRNNVQKRLEKGEIVGVKPANGPDAEHVFITANPEKGTLTIEDFYGKYLPHEQFKVIDATQKEGRVERHNSHEPRQQLDDPNSRSLHH